MREYSDMVPPVIAPIPAVDEMGPIDVLMSYQPLEAGVVCCDVADDSSNVERRFLSRSRLEKFMDCSRKIIYYAGGDYFGYHEPPYEGDDFILHLLNRDRPHTGTELRMDFDALCDFICDTYASDRALHGSDF